MLTLRFQSNSMKNRRIYMHRCAIRRNCSDQAEQKHQRWHFSVNILLSMSLKTEELRMGYNLLATLGNLQTPLPSSLLLVPPLLVPPLPLPLPPPLLPATPSEVHLLFNTKSFHGHNPKSKVLLLYY